jgi:hypothetical protein
MLNNTTLDVMRVIFLLGALVFGMLALTAIFKRRYGQFVGMLILGAVSTVAPMFLFPSSGTTSKTPTVPATPIPKPEYPYAASTATQPASTSSPSSEAPHMPWELFGFIIVVLIVLGVVISGLMFAFSCIKKNADAKAENIGAWKDLIKRHDDIRAQWVSYETDMGKLIDMPVMTDMREPVIIALHKALKTASSLAPKSLAKLSYTPIRDSAFLAAVNDLEVAFNSAEQTAKKIAWSKFTKEERRSLSTAKQLLSLAMDSRASPAERQAAYKRVFKELQGLIEFPEKAILEVESRHQLSLAA